MDFNVRYSDEAVERLRKMRAYERSAILDQIEAVLTKNPTTESKSKIKRLKQPAPTQYRMRVGEFRVFYDVEEQDVLIIEILSKSESIPYLDDFK